MPKKQQCTPKRRLNGEGSFSQRADGSWKCQITVNDGMGKTIRKSIYGKTLPECKSKMETFKKENDGKTFADIQRGKITLGEWGDECLKEAEQRVKNKKLKQNTYSRYECHLRVHIKPYIGKVKLSKLTDTNIDNFHVALSKTDLSPHTIRDISAYLNLLLKQAVAAKLISANPFDSCRRSLIPGKESPDLRLMDDEQIVSFLRAIEGHSMENLFRFTLFEGLRMGEVLGLTWDCWDSEKGTLRIDKQLQYNRQTHIYYFEGNKTKQSRRILSLPDSMNLVLKNQRKRQLEQQMKAGSLWNNEDNLVFTDAYGNHYCQPTVRRNIKKIFAKIGTPETRFHDLRHTFTALCIESGDDIKNIQSNLGHSTAKTTLDVYAYLTQNAKRASAQRMEQTIQRLG